MAVLGAGGAVNRFLTRISHVTAFTPRLTGWRDAHFQCWEILRIPVAPAASPGPEPQSQGIWSLEVSSAGGRWSKGTSRSRAKPGYSQPALCHCSHWISGKIPRLRSALLSRRKVSGTFPAAGHFLIKLFAPPSLCLVFCVCPEFKPTIEDIPSPVPWALSLLV